MTYICSAWNSEQLIALSQTTEVTAKSEKSVVKKLTVFNVYNPTSTEIIKEIDHGSSVNCVQFFPNGFMIAVGSKDKKIAVYNIGQKNQEILSWRTHKASVLCLDISPFGDMIVSGDDDAMVVLLNVNDVSDIRILSHNPTWGAVGAIKFSHCGALVVVGDAKGVVHVFNSKQNLICEFVAHKKEINAIDFSHCTCGKGSQICTSLLITASSDKTCKLFNIHALIKEQKTDPDIVLKHTLHVFATHQKEIYTACFVSGGRYVATGSRDKTVRIYDTEGGIIMTSLILL